MLLTALVASGAPAEAPDVRRGLAVANDLSGTSLALLALAMTAGSILLQPFIRSASNALKGDGGWKILKWVHERGISAGQRRRSKLQDRLSATLRADRSERSAAARAALSAKLDRMPETDLRPTRLGNLISRVEADAGRRYGFDTRLALPRLEPVLRESVVNALKVAREELNFSVRLTVTSILSAVSSAGLLYRHGWWLLVPAAALISAWLCYLNALAAATKYGLELQVAFDLDRFELYKASHEPPPASEADELALARKLMATWRTGRVAAEGVEGYR